MYFMALIKRICQISRWHEKAILVLLFFLIFLCNSFVELLQLEYSKLLQQTPSRGMRLKMTPHSSTFFFPGIIGLIDCDVFLSPLKYTACSEITKIEMLVCSTVVTPKSYSFIEFHAK